MLDYDFPNSIGYWSHMASQAFQRALNEELKPHGITSRQCHVLGYLALEGPLSQTDLAERMNVEPPTLVGILDRMERDGWICRRVCPTDRRKKIVAPTPAARPVWARIVECARRVRTRATRGLTREQVQDLMRMLDAVQQNLASDVSAEVA